MDSDFAHLPKIWGRNATDGTGLSDAEQQTLMQMKHDLPRTHWPKFMEMVEFLGVPDVPRAPYEVTRSKDVMSLWQLWTGQNAFVSEVIERDLQATGGYITDIFPRKEWTAGTSGTHQSIVFESQVMDSVPEMASNQRLGSYQESQSFTLDPKGISFIMQQDFIYAPDGRLLFMRHCKQLERCVDDTIAVGTLWEIKKVGVEMMLYNLPAMPMPRSAFFRTVQQFIMYFGMFQKMRAGHVKVQAEAVRRSELAGAQQLDVEILPTSRALIYSQFVDPQNTQYYRGGSTTLDKEIRDDKNYVSTAQFKFIRSHTSRPYNFPNMEGPNDMMVEHRTVGEHFIANDITVGRIPMKDYRSAHRTVRVGHSEKVMAEVPLLDLLDHALFYDPEDPDGALTEHGAALLRKIIFEEATAHRRDEAHYREFAYGSAAGGGAADGDGDAEMSEKKYGGGGKKGKKRSRAAASSDYPVPTLFDLYDSAGMLDELLAHFKHDTSNEVRAKFLQAAKVTDSSDLPAAKKGKGGAGVGMLLDVSESDDVTITADVLKSIPLSGKSLRAVVHFNLRLPIQFIGRRNITLETGQYVALHSGGDTGVIYTGKTIINLSRNTKQRLIGVDLNFDVCSFIYPHGRKNVIYIPDVLVLDYIRGYETTFYGYGDNRADDELQQSKCIHVFAVNQSWRTQSEYLDDTGVVNRDMLLPEGHSNKLCYPTAAIYSDYWKFGPPTHLFLFESFVDQQRVGHTFSLQGYQEYSVPTNQLTHPDAGFVLGQGHLGTRITSNTFKVFRGEVTHLTDPTPESVGGATRRIEA